MTLDVAAVLNGTVASVLAVGSDGTVTERRLHTADLAHEFAHVCIDSRDVARSDLFVALPGTRVDGHAFLDAAFEAGARAVLVSRPVEIDRRFASSEANDR